MTSLVLLLFSLAAATTAAAAEKPVDFNRDIRPLLSDNCFHCHGPDEARRMVGLRLDTREGAFAPRPKGAPIVPGHPDQSLLIQRITNEKKAFLMPPVSSGFALNPAQIALLKRWIAEGAKWEEHWAYRAPVRPQPPQVSRASGPRNPIDQFILARLDKEGLKPAREAPRETLIRRLSFDLTGLPPSPAAVRAFLADRSPDAYEKLVDRLLASPQYGERMAMQWLDLARYADTHGFHIDSGRDMWPWRDWLISAFNRNLPFDQFTLWQLAGDLLPEATREQQVATGFNRNHMINFEGGAIPEEYQNEYVVDRVDTTSNVWMGMTMGCARCHDHKYDPIRQKDFYRFAAFFNTISEEGLDGRTGNAKPFLPLPDEAQQAELDRIESELLTRGAALDDDLIGYLETFWEKNVSDKEPQSPTEGLSAWYELDGSLSDLSGHFRHGRLVKGDLIFNNGPVRRALSLDGNTVIRFPASALDTSKPFSIAFWLRVGRNPGQTILRQGSGFQISLLKPKTLPGLKRGHPIEVRFRDSKGREQVLRTPGFELLQGRTQHVVLSRDSSGDLRILLDGTHEILRAPLDSASTDSPIDLLAGTVDDLRFYERALDANDAEQLAVNYPAEVLLATPGKRSREQFGQLRHYFLTHAAGAELREAYQAWRAAEKYKNELEAKIPTVMVMDTAEKPRDTYVLARGDYSQKKEKVDPGTPSFLPALPAGEPPNRLTLARWLVSPEHPLTARVAVNRYWQMYFGHGIVKTSEDFGSQGEPPVHAELLDWLATEFVRNGWDIKALQRLIVTSAAYRQESKVTPALLERDPENRLLARGPRFRLPAEMVRDNALAVSGLLAGKIGGPSVLPYQPPGLWEELAFGENFSFQEYEQDHGEKLHRRSMYTFWKRTAPPASLSTFDAPDREKCTARRPVTNTPLQALVTLNDPTYVEASRHLAARVLSAPDAKTDDQRLREAFRMVTAREPQRRELTILRDALHAQIREYQRHPESAAKLLSVGEAPAESAASKPVLAAWTNVCTVLLNLDEAITKE